jgi:hypothetical protein
MSAQIWRISIFGLLLVTSLITTYALLTLLWLFGGASWWGALPLVGSLLLFATCGWILLWPRFGSWIASVLLLCITCWPIITITSDLAYKRSLDPFLVALLLPIAVGLWFTLREALGFTRHVSPKPGLIYLSFGLVMIVLLPTLLFANFYSTHKSTEVREFPVGFRGHAVIVWGEASYPHLPISRGKLIEHFPPNGVIITSTRMPAGWGKDELYFYDSAGHRRNEPSLLAQEGTGEMKENEQRMQYSELFIGTKEELARQSLEEKEQRIEELFGKLHRSVHR